MKTKIKIILSVFLPVILITGITFSYFFSKSETNNTFTVGNVDIEIIEEEWEKNTDENNNDIPDEAENMCPRKNIIKDPKIKNTGKNNAFVYFAVSIPKDNIVTVNPDTNELENNGVAHSVELFSFNHNSGWTLFEEDNTSENEKIYYYYYNEKIVPEESTTTLFDNVTYINALEGEINPSEILNININAYAIQSDYNGNKVTPLEAWDLCTVQMGMEE